MGETHVNEQKSMAELMGEETPNQEKHKSDVDRLSSLRKKTDLSDIILEKENSTAARNKKIVLGAASLVLLFLVFLIISKMLNTDTSSTEVKKETKTKTVKEVLAKNEDSKAKDESKKPAIEPKETQKDETVTDTDLKFEEMVKKLREEDAKESDDQIVKVVTPPTVEKEAQIKKVPVKKVEEIKKAKTVNKPKPKIIITEVKKPEVKKSNIITKPTVTKQKSNLLFSSKSGYYIQVGATTTPTPNKFLVNKLRSNSYNYITHPIIVKGRKFYKVLIGPFPTKDVAKAKLPRVKATINPQAFLYHLR